MDRLRRLRIALNCLDGAARQCLDCAGPFIGCHGLPVDDGEADVVVTPESVGRNLAAEASGGKSQEGLTAPVAEGPKQLSRFPNRVPTGGAGGGASPVPFATSLATVGPAGFAPARKPPSSARASSAFGTWGQAAEVDLDDVAADFSSSFTVRGLAGIKEGAGTGI